MPEAWEAVLCGEALQCPVLRTQGPLGVRAAPGKPRFPHHQVRVHSSRFNDPK